MAEAMKNEAIPLYSLETKRPLSEFDVVGFTLQYEMSYTNILYMLDLGNITLNAHERGEEEPFVMAGGPCATTPEPLADFMDCFLIGEGERLNIEVMDKIKAGRAKGLSRKDILRSLATMEGVYVPSLYEVKYKEDGTILSHRPMVDEAKPVIKRVRLHDMNDTFNWIGKSCPFWKRFTIEPSSNCSAAAPKAVASARQG